MPCRMGWLCLGTLPGALVGGLRLPGRCQVDNLISTTWSARIVSNIISTPSSARIMAHVISTPSSARIVSDVISTPSSARIISHVISTPSSARGAPCYRGWCAPAYPAAGHSAPRRTQLPGEVRPGALCYRGRCGPAHCPVQGYRERCAPAHCRAQGYREQCAPACCCRGRCAPLPGIVRPGALPSAGLPGTVLPGKAAATGAHMLRRAAVWAAAGDKAARLTAMRAVPRPVCPAYRPASRPIQHRWAIPRPIRPTLPYCLLRSYGPT